MKISELLKSKEITISCELFPPKKGSELQKAHDLVREIAQLCPTFISVTYGATGGISEHTVNLANEAQNVNGITALAHLTGASSDRNKIQEVLGELKQNKIEIFWLCVVISRKMPIFPCRTSTAMPVS